MSGCNSRIRPYIISNEIDEQKKVKQKAGCAVFPEEISFSNAYFWNKFRGRHGFDAGNETKGACRVDSNTRTPITVTNSRKRRKLRSSSLRAASTPPKVLVPRFFWSVTENKLASPTAPVGVAKLQEIAFYTLPSGSFKVN